MYLLDDGGRPLNAEFSLAFIDAQQCIIVESSGGASAQKSEERRNPDYNKLVHVLFARMAVADIRITRIVLDSKIVQQIPLSDRTVLLDEPYPINPRTVDIEKFRTAIGRTISLMYRAPAASVGGNAQKRIRICLDRTVLPEELLTGSNQDLPSGGDIEYTPGLADTEREELRAARRGQGKFRRGLFKRWGKVCALTGIENEDLLTASHIKPWNACTNPERLDPNNGILLSALLDRLFDRRLISFSDDGAMLISPRLTLEDRKLCGLDVAKRIAFSTENKHLLAYHRNLRFLSE